MRRIALTPACLTFACVTFTGVTFTGVTSGGLAASGRLLGQPLPNQSLPNQTLPNQSLPNQTLPNTRPLELEGDIASQLVAGADRFLLREIEASVAKRASHFQRDVSSREAYDASLAPNRERLRHILGARDARVPFRGLEFVADTSAPSLVGEAASYEIHRVRWPAFGDVHGEGLLLRPKSGPPSAFVVAIPHADLTPEALAGLEEGVPPDRAFAQRLAERGALVVVPTLIDRRRGKSEWRPIGRGHNIANREFLYRSAFELGRHIVGYELQKVLAVVDWFEREQGDVEGAPRIGVIGYGDGGMLALYAAALDPRIDATVVSGYFENRNVLWQQPIDRGVFGLLEQFGDAELATMVAPRRLLVEAAKHPTYELPSGTGGAPARIETPKLETVRGEVDRAHAILEDWPESSGWIQWLGDGKSEPVSRDTLGAFDTALGVPESSRPKTRDVAKGIGPDFDPRERATRQFRELEAHSRAVLRESPYVRQRFLSKLDTSSVEAYETSVEGYREHFRHEVIGHFDRPLLPPNVRSRKIDEQDGVRFYEVVLDVFPDVIAYGILCLPEGVEDGAPRPAVVCQHGLEGRPQSVIGEEQHHYYKAFATELAKRGFVTFAPQNLYIFQDRFRTLQRKAYLIKKTLFSLIVPQHQQIVDWLQALPYVDEERVGFYGLSYGGKTAMRVPPLVTDYCLSICSADFNEWVDKNASTINPRSYVWTGEYEIFEFDLGSTFNYAEMAALICPRPFMVERGHYDGVSDDWTVGWEFAKVRFLYQGRLKLEGRAEIEWFDGPHSINGRGTYDFLHRHLRWPAPAEPK